MTIQEILTQADLNTKTTLLKLFDAIQSVHDECTKKQNEVEKIDEHYSFDALQAHPPADVKATLQACGELITKVNQKHAVLLKQKAQTLKDIRAQLV